ncbi:MAG TPA: hypothetical protein PKZ36_00285 [Candidatus Paceibacterota bacterium]|nr:hypothetical protein [Candidatus Paceibacterota bacterium]HPT17840.1 hypothetical protein [Candidatus Paceibacterota bacterium]
MEEKILTLNHKEKIINLFSVIDNYLDLSDKGGSQIVKVPHDVLNNLNISFGEANSLIQFVNKNIGSIDYWVNILNGNLEFTDVQALFMSEENVSPVDNVYRDDEKYFLILEIINWKLYKKNLLSFLQINKLKLSSNDTKKIDNGNIILMIDEVKKEIFRKDNNKFIHRFRKTHGKNKRFEYIINIYNNPKIGGSDLAKGGTLQNLSKEINNLNKKIKTELRLSEKIIVNDDNTGYQINDKYNIEFM